MKNQMFTAKCMRTRAALVATATFFSVHAVSAQASNQLTKEAENFWYVQGSLGVLNDSYSTVDSKLSEFVQVSGRTFFEQGKGGSIAFGRQIFEPEKADRPGVGRVEVEAIAANTKRSSVRLGALTSPLDDTVRAKALMVNVLARVHDSEEKAQNKLPVWRTWFGFGIGYGNISYPSANLSNCNCLRAGESDGEVAIQAKLAVERQIGRDMMLVAQAARLWLPGASFGSGPYPQTQYGDWGLTTYSLGLRIGFR